MAYADFGLSWQIASRICDSYMYQLLPNLCVPVPKTSTNISVQDRQRSNRPR